jgi:hypothetical protein
MTKKTLDYVSKILVPDIYTKIRGLEIRIEQLEQKEQNKKEAYFLESW